MSGEAEDPHHGETVTFTEQQIGIILETQLNATNGRRYVMIKKISRGTAADHNEHLRERMILYKLNGQSVVDVSEDDVKRRISQLGRPLTVTFVHRPEDIPGAEGGGGGGVTPFLMPDMTRSLGNFDVATGADAEIQVQFENTGEKLGLSLGEYTFEDQKYHRLNAVQPGPRSAAPWSRGHGLGNHWRAVAGGQGIRMPQLTAGLLLVRVAGRAVVGMDPDLITRTMRDAPWPKVLVFMDPTKRPPPPLASIGLSGHVLGASAFGPRAGGEGTAEQRLARVCHRHVLIHPRTHTLPHFFHTPVKPSTALTEPRQVLADGKLAEAHTWRLGSQKDELEESTPGLECCSRRGDLTSRCQPPTNRRFR
jgi:hypothetical protein